MPRVIRRALAVLAGLVVAVAVVMLVDILVAQLHPLPAGMDLRDSAAMREAIAAMPGFTLALLVVGWALAAAAGALVAVRLTTERWRAAGIIVVILLLASTVANLAMLPHPVWVWPAALLLIPLAGWSGIRIATLHL